MSILKRLLMLDTIFQVPDDKLQLFTENHSPWDYTDDTEMTIGVINALLSDQPFFRRIFGFQVERRIR